MTKVIRKYLALAALVAATYALQIDFRTPPEAGGAVVIWLTCLLTFVNQDVKAHNGRSASNEDGKEDGEAVLQRMEKLSLSESDIRRFARLAFVDDDEVLQVVDNLAARGYAAAHIRSVRSSRDVPVDLYHIAFVDISGVGKGVYDDEGAGLIEHMRRAFPLPVLVTYTAVPVELGSPRYTTINSNVDFHLRKDSEIDDHIQAINLAAQKYFSVGRLLAGLCKVAGGQPEVLRATLASQSSEKQVRREIWKIADDSSSEGRAIRYIYTMLESLSGGR